MEPIAETPTKVRFGVFEADLLTEELRRSGTKIKIQHQPFKVLSMMLERPGEVVSREEMQQRLWGNETTVDFDRSLGTAINKLREALGDVADNPRFVETLARRGYRFIAPVTVAAVTAGQELHPDPSITDPPALFAVPARDPHPPMKDSDSSRRWIRFFWSRFSGLAWVIAGFCGLLALCFWGWARLQETRIPTPLRISQVTFSGRIFPGEPLQENLAATATDGSRIYFQQIVNGQAVLAQGLIADGETSILGVPSEISAPSLGNISPDGSKLLVRNYLIPEAEQPLWIIPTLGGTARKFANLLGHDASWMPDGKRILYATGTDLLLADENGAEVRKFASLPGRAFWLRWSPDGSHLRFTMINSLNHSTSLWEISSTGSDLHPLLPRWSNPASECCGSWTPDGKYFVFQSAHNGMNNIWALKQGSFPANLFRTQPRQITNGPLSYQSPIAAITGHRLFFIGLDTRSVLLKYDAGAKQFVPYGKMLNAAQLVDFSRDGKFFAWINPEDSSLWRSGVDGSQRLQLTTPPMQVFMMHWSPDGSRIVLMGKEPGKLWRVYIVDAQGGNLVPLLDDTRNEADPDWSPDGKSIVFGRLPELMAEKSLPKSIYLMDLKTRQLTALPQSEGLFSPRWSPDGRYIAAMPLDESKLVLYDTTSHGWKTLVDRPAHDPVWSNDGRWIYFHDFAAADQPIDRVSIPDGKLEQVADLKSVQPLDVLDFRFAGLASGNVPLVNARISTSNIYSINLDRR